MPILESGGTAGCSNSVGTFRLFITAPRSSVAGKAVSMTVSVTDQDTGKVENHKNLFAGPDQD